MRPETPFIMPETRTYLRDCFDHSVAVLDLLESYREMCNGLMEVYLLHASNRMSEVMKTMAIITVFFMPLSFLAGIYGMNLERDVGNMPGARLEVRLRVLLDDRGGHRRRAVLRG